MFIQKPSLWERGKREKKSPLLSTNIVAGTSALNPSKLRRAIEKKEKKSITGDNSSRRYMSD